MAATSQRGLTLIEVLVSLILAALVLSAFSGLASRALEVERQSNARNELLSEARFAMQRMTTAVLGTSRLMLPLADNPASGWRENVREQTVPASSPESGSTLATAVLAVSLDPRLDVDENGVLDADNDADGRVDEDPDIDNTNDGENGIVGIDDDGDGAGDEGGMSGNDNDEDGVQGEDWLDGLDNDGDGTPDEDLPEDSNNDNRPGERDIDDDGDGAVDEGNTFDDDEDGSSNEDWVDPVVFFLDGSTLTERRPDLNASDGTDFTEFSIAENVTRFRVERLPDGGGRAVLVDITLQLTAPDGEDVVLTTRIRAGGGR